MDSNHQEQSTSHHEEAPLDLQNDDLLGVGRLYGCGFCKRGFNTAQALGGHMNIHRSIRDHRAEKKKPVSTNLTHKPQGKLRLDFLSCDDCAGQPSSSFPTECFPASMGPGSNISSLGIHFLTDNSPVGNEDYDTDLASGSGYGPGLSLGKRKEVKKVGRCEKEEVDLELRLGL